MFVVMWYMYVTYHDYRMLMVRFRAKYTLMSLYGNATSRELFYITLTGYVSVLSIKYAILQSYLNPKLLFIRDIKNVSVVILAVTANFTQLFRTDGHIVGSTYVIVALR